MLAFTHAGYVGAGYGICFVVLAGYALRTVRRGRAVARQVPPEERRWT
jgi:heme exporter protein CcmD